MDETAKGRADAVTRVVPYREDLRSHFERLNREWIERHFRLEEADLAEIRDPHATFVTPGGQIFFVEEAGTIVGTCAIAPHACHPGEFHLSKMAVAEEARGRGHGDRLMRAAVAFSRNAGARSVSLVSNRRLTPALRLYEKHGFQEVPLDPEEQYSRADIKMQLDLEADKTDTPEIVSGFRPGYLGRIAQMHGEFYAGAWGSGTGFEALMARELADFYEGYDPAQDLLLTAHVGGRLVSSIAVNGSRSERTDAARLRWFLTESAHQGRGIGSRLLRQALGFCRDAGFTSVYLWTVEGLPQSWGMYEHAGFRVTERHPDSRYTVPRIHVRMEMGLAP
jgi:GNAT superfamily N-acetyltransferase